LRLSALDLPGVRRYFDIRRNNSYGTQLSGAVD
jgi:hypothetical protein